MLGVSQNLTQFNCALQKQIPHLSGVQSGTWHKLRAFFQRLIGCDVEQRLCNIGKMFCNELDRLEKIPVPFAGTTEEVVCDLQYKGWMEAGKSVKRLLKKSSSPVVQGVLHEVAYRLTALRYRIEPLHGGFQVDQNDGGLYEKISSIAVEAKMGNSLMVDKGLNERDKEKLVEVCHYPKFVKLLLKADSIRDLFLKSILRERVDVGLFVQYPHLFKQLRDCYLIPKIGFYSRPILQVEKRENEKGQIEKIVTLPFHTDQGVKRISIFDEKKLVTLQHGWTLPIKEIYKIFSLKNMDPGDIEFFGSVGIANWNSRELGPYVPDPQHANQYAHRKRAVSALCTIWMKVHQVIVDTCAWLKASLLPLLGYSIPEKAYQRIDLDIPEWWKQMPIFESYTKDEVEKRNSIFLEEDGERKTFPVLEQGEWLVCVNADRTTLDLDLDDRHGYMEVYIPQNDGTYLYYPFSKFAEKFAVNLPEKVAMIVGTTPAKVAYPDENVYYSQRQHASVPIILSAKQGLSLMELIKTDIIKARSKNLVFQFGAENCAHWVQVVLGRVKGLPPTNLFVFPLLHSDPGNVIMKYIFSVIKLMPEKHRYSALDMLDILFGSMRGMYVQEEGELVWKSHATSYLRKRHMICQPGFLHKQIEENTIKGYIFNGHR